MNFTNELKAVVDGVEGAQAAALMGFDGIVVADAKPAGGQASYQEIGVELSRLLKEAAKVSLGNDAGGLEELVVSTEKNRFVLRVLNDEYFMLLMLGSGSNLGQGRFFLRRVAPAIRKEL
ncbi:MAG: hypothetical protein V1495_10220 [Pseudomonadota bacterium]